MSLPTWNAFDDQCPTRQVLDRIADKWTVLIVSHLASGRCRFGELRRAILGISPKMLTLRLRDLERDGIITRRVYASVPPKVEYRLTPLGQTLIELLGAVRVWAEDKIELILAARQEFDERVDIDEPAEE